MQLKSSRALTKPSCSNQETFWGSQPLSGEDILCSMNSILGSVSYPFITTLCKFSMNNVNAMYVLME